MGGSHRNSHWSWIFLTIALHTISPAEAGVASCAVRIRENLHLRPLSRAYLPGTVTFLDRQFGYAPWDEEFQKIRQDLEGMLETQKPEAKKPERYWILHRPGSRKILGGVGIARASRAPADEAWLFWFALDPELRGSGLGQELLERTEKEARELGIVHFYISTSTHEKEAAAQVLYTRNGYRLIDQSKGPPEYDHLLYVKRLDR